MTNEKLKYNLEKIGFEFKQPEFATKCRFIVSIDSEPKYIEFKTLTFVFSDTFTFWYEFLNFYNRHKHKDK